MKGTINLGRTFGIKIQIHWTFVFIIIWVLYIALKNESTLQNSLINVLFILVLFACVVLHELGHALMAKRFNIKTKSITLLPIGGVASLEKMPDKPKEELLVAIAGPLVNLGIALLLFMVLPIQKYTTLDQAAIEELTRTINTQNFMFQLFSANVILVIFNLIPAFPMDGGRVLRALLSMRISRKDATNIAASLGQFLSFIFFVIGILYNPFLIFIALFIFLAAQGENQMEHQLSIIKGHTIKEAMLTNLTKVTPEVTLKEIIDLLLSGTEKDFIVVDEEGKLIGLLHYSDIIKNLKNSECTVKDMMVNDYKTLDANAPLKEAVNTITNLKKKFIPVLENGEFIGAIDLQNLSEFILLNSNLTVK